MRFGALSTAYTADDKDCLVFHTLNHSCVDVINAFYVCKHSIAV